MLLMALLLGGVVGCGQKGPLTLPRSAPADSTPATTAAAPAASAAR